jgi:hypothetical protein
VSAPNGNRERCYVGDGVYAEVDEWGNVILTVPGGSAITAGMMLEPAVWGSLHRFVSETFARRQAEHERLSERTDEWVEKLREDGE